MLELASTFTGAGSSLGVVWAAVINSAMESPGYFQNAAQTRGLRVPVLSPGPQSPLVLLIQ